MVKKILSILAWVVTGAALVALFIFAREDYLDTPIQSINVDIDRNADSGFVKKKVILADMNTLCATAKIGTINMLSISKQLKANPWIESSSSFVDLNANLNVKLKEYEPVMRVFGTNGMSAYITSEGIMIPISRNHTPHVLIASGHFDLDSIQLNHKLCDSIESERNVLNAKYLLEAIERNSFMKERIGQIYCTENNEFEIVAKGIGSRIIIGDTCNIDDKLKRLEIFIEQKANSLEIKKYNTINLKYKNQIVCTKR